MGSYVLKESSSGHKTLSYKNGEEIRIHSAYNPEEEAERAAAGFTKGRSSHVIALGLGLGYHMHALKKRYPGIAFAAAECDREAADLALTHCNENISGVTIIRSPADLALFFDEIDMTTFRGISYYFHRPSYLLHKNFYDGIIREASQLISSKISDLLTRFEFEERWIKNILANIPRVFTTHTVKSLFGRFRGYPGIIVSAGPSLKKNALSLNSLRDRAVIVCVDTAFKVLERMNVRPHIVMTLDAQKHSLRHFLGIRGSDPLLLCDVVSLPDIMRVYPGKKMLGTTSKFYTNAAGVLKREPTPLMDWIEKFVPEIGDIQSGGSVATSAFDLLLSLGCDPIILIGQDLAYTGREIHCAGTHHNDDWLPTVTRILNLETINQKVIRKRKIKYVESYGGGTVISDFVFDLYRGWFEDSAKKVKASVINATGGGARIKNTAEKPLSDLCRELKPRKITPDAILSEILSENPAADPDRLRSAVVSAAEEIRILGNKVKSCLEKDTLDEKILDELESGDSALILKPYLRKTWISLSRLNTGREKALAMVYQNIAAACDRIVPSLRRCAENLHNLYRR